MDLIIPDASPELLARLERAELEIGYLECCFEGARRVLDIGCGPALASIWLARMLCLDELVLMDGPMGEKQMGYHEVKLAWCDMALTGRIAEVNGVRHRIVAPDPGATYEVDAVMSLLSWGHHYPVSTYAGLLVRSGATRLIIDLRRGKGGLSELEALGFAPRNKLAETHKLERYYLTKE